MTTEERQENLRPRDAFEESDLSPEDEAILRQIWEERAARRQTGHDAEADDSLLFERPDAPLAYALDPQGGAAPVDPARAAAVDFVTYPESVKGSNCSNCRFEEKGVCTHPEVSPNRDQPVTDRNCCAKWDAAGTLRDWQAGGQP